MTQWQLKKIGEKMTLNKTLILLLALAILSIFTTSNLNAIGGDLGLVQTVVTYDKDVYSVGDEMTVTIDFQLDTEKNHRDMKCYIPSLTTQKTLHRLSIVRPETKVVSFPNDLMLSNDNPSAQLMFKFILSKKIITGEGGISNTLSIIISYYMINPKDNVDLSNHSHLSTYASGVNLFFKFNEPIFKKQPLKRETWEDLRLEGSSLDKKKWSER
jgi:hypothetical protein